MEGRFTGYKLPTPNSFVAALAPGPDGAMWFTEADANRVGRITMDGRITEFVLPTPDGPYRVETASAAGVVAQAASR